MNAVPRTVAEGPGALYREMTGEDESRYSVGKARAFLKSLEAEEWDQTRDADASLSGDGYKRVRGILSGEVIHAAAWP